MLDQIQETDVSRPCRTGVRGAAPRETAGEARRMPSPPATCRKFPGRCPQPSGGQHSRWAKEARVRARAGQGDGDLRGKVSHSGAPPICGGPSSLWLKLRAACERKRPRPGQTARNGEPRPPRASGGAAAPTSQQETRPETWDTGPRSAKPGWGQSTPTKSCYTCYTV